MPEFAGYPHPPGGLFSGSATNQPFVPAGTGAAAGAIVTIAPAGGSSAPSTPLAANVLPGSTPIPVNTALPAITGTAQEGQTLALSNGTWTNSPSSFAKQFKRNGGNIGGAVGDTYVLTNADVGATITGTVIASNAGGPSAPATSAATSVVSAAGGGGGADTRPGWFAAPTNAATVGTEAFITGRNIVPGSTNGGKAGTAVLTTTGSNYAWFAIANAAAVTFLDVASGFTGGFTLIGSPANVAGTDWYLYRSDFPASYSAAQVTIS